MAGERERIEFLVRRDGTAAAAAWVRRTLQIYRRAVLSRDPYGREYRRVLIGACCDFKRWLAGQPNAGQGPGG